MIDRGRDQEGGKWLTEGMKRLQGKGFGGKEVVDRGRKWYGRGW